MIRVELKGLDQVRRNLTDMKKQVRFAAAKSLTQTAAKVKEAMPAALDKALDRPTPFTKRGIYVKRATPVELVAEVGFMPKQAAYLQYQIAGGRYTPGAAGMRLASAIGRDAYGGIPRGLIKQLIAVANNEKKLGKVKARRIKVSAKVELFYGDPVDHAGKAYPRGIYKRVDLGGRHQLVPLIVFSQKTVTYKPRFNFQREAEAVVRREFDAIFKRNLDEAIRTAR